MFNFIVFNSASLVGGILFGAIGAMLLFVVSYFHWKGVYDSKNTTGLINKFLIFSCVTASLFIAASIAYMAGKGKWSEGLTWPMIVGNLCSLIANLLVFKIKQSNVKAAAEKGLSEKEYYVKYIAPSVESKNI